MCVREREGKREREGARGKTKEEKEGGGEKAFSFFLDRPFRQCWCGRAITVSLVSPSVDRDPLSAV